MEQAIHACAAADIDMRLARLIRDGACRGLAQALQLGMGAPPKT